MQLTGQITDVGAGDGFTINVDWGDGQTEVVTLAAGTSLFSLGHRYADNRPNATNANPFTITVDVSDDDLGNRATASTTVAVSNLAPTITSLAFRNQVIGSTN